MNYYGSITPEISAREMKNAALARRAAAESFVLLKNDGTLPLKEKKIALYGMGARKTVSGGEGSGDVAPRYKVSIEQGLENAGFVITSKAWLDDYDAEFAETYEAYRQMVEEKIAHIPNPVAQIPAAHSYKYRYPSGRRVSEADVAASDTDTAVYVLMRQAGESNDRRDEPGDFRLTDIEKDNLRFLAAHYTHTVLIVNVGGLVDLSVLDEVDIGAVVYFVQGGMEGGNALADVLSGKANFSGRLADTWPRSYADIPYGDQFSALNGDLENEEYTEGVLVGYRWNDANGITPRWPFGFGLSYTSFVLSDETVSCEGDTVTVKVTVINTGSVPGREVVQVYLKRPGEAHKNLCAFAKTGELAPGASEAVTLTFDLTHNAAWDEAAHRWVLPAGEYAVLVGQNSADVSVAGCFTLESRTLPVPHVDTAPVESAWVKSVLDSLTAEEMIELHRGGDLQNNGPGQHIIMGAGGKTCITLTEKGIPNVVFSDGPAGVNIMEEVVYGPDGSQKTAKMPEKYNWGLMRKMASRFIGTEGQHVYRYATAWPVEALLAQSWDPALLTQIGEAVGTELREFGITLWLAPGMNIHRNPLCGRTFEYYSEDPHLTGKLAAALTRGVQSHKGVGVTIKHFCCNNQEDNRAAVSENVSEKALREIYLRGFEIAVKESAPLALMTSYNKVNGIYSGERRDLIQGILRDEWGFAGLVMTDWDTRYNALAALNASVDLMMPGLPADRDTLLAALAEKKLDLTALRRAAARVLAVVELGTAVLKED